MTRGYYVIEKGNQVLKAVYLSGDAYLDCGYGERILKAFAEDRETEYLDYLFDEITPQEKEDVRDIVPEWYRITKKSNHRPYIDYGYVLKNNTLRVYYYGKLLFVVKKDTANKWINAIKHTIKYSNIIIETPDRKQFSVKQIKDQVEAAGVKSGKIYVVPAECKAYCEDGKNNTVEVALTAEN